jgi:hypothetical protein
MLADERRTLTLEVDPSADPIAGLVRAEDGAERDFSGWVGLAAALERALQRTPGEQPDGEEVEC